LNLVSVTYLSLSLVAILTSPVDAGFSSGCTLGSLGYPGFGAFLSSNFQVPLPLIIKLEPYPLYFVVIKAFVKE